MAANNNNAGSDKNKLLLMGRRASGKTSMRSIIFANYLARDTWRLGVTMDVEHSHLTLMGNLVLSLWDCGGQDRFMENYFKSQREHIFRDVKVIIYVFDVGSKERKADMAKFKECVAALQEFSPNCKMFCLLHKMDLLLTEQHRQQVFEERSAEIRKITQNLRLECFRTSIWDASLYQAWSSIVHALLPNTIQIEKGLDKLCDLCGADEVILFEKSTFLMISHSNQRKHADEQRFEKISNIVKQFKLSCQNHHCQFYSLEVRNSNYSAFVETFTSTTYVMVVMSDPDIQPSATLLNIDATRHFFEKIVKA